MQNPMLIIVTNINNYHNTWQPQGTEKVETHKLIFKSPSEDQGGGEKVHPKGNLLQVS